MSTAAITLAQFAFACSGKTLSELEQNHPTEAVALKELYSWGAGPHHVRTYMETHALSSFAETVAFVSKSP